MNFTEEQKFQMALSFAHAKTNQESDPKDFLNYVYLLLDEFDESAKKSIANSYDTEEPDIL